MPPSSRSCGTRTVFSATTSPRSWTARQPTPMPPFPSGPTIRQGPLRAGASTPRSLPARATQVEGLQALLQTGDPALERRSVGGADEDLPVRHHQLQAAFLRLERDDDEVAVEVERVGDRIDARDLVGREQL